MVVALISAAWACDEMDGARVDTLLEEARGAWQELDLDTFRSRVETLTGSAGCFTDDLSRDQAAEIHRLVGVRAFIARDRPGASQSFASARRVEPAYRFPTNLVPSGNPLLDWYDGAEPTPVTTVAPPRDGRLEIDGHPSLEYPDGAPALVQMFGADGALTYTAYHGPEQGLPEYDPATPGMKLGVRYDAKVIPLHVPLTVGAVVTGAAGMGLYGAGLVNKRRFNSTSSPPPYEDLPQIRSRANTFSAAGVAMGAAALTLGTTAVLSRRF